MSLLNDKCKVHTIPSEIHVSHTLNVNRDDASGFCLDTLFTHKQYATPEVKGCRHI